MSFHNTRGQPKILTSNFDNGEATFRSQVGWKYFLIYVLPIVALGYHYSLRQIALALRGPNTTPSVECERKVLLPRLVRD